MSCSNFIPIYFHCFLERCRIFHSSYGFLPFISSCSKDHVLRYSMFFYYLITIILKWVTTILGGRSEIIQWQNYKGTNKYWPKTARTEKSSAYLILYDVFFSKARTNWDQLNNNRNKIRNLFKNTSFIIE